MQKTAKGWLALRLRLEPVSSQGYRFGHGGLQSCLVWGSGTSWVDGWIHVFLLATQHGACMQAIVYIGTYVGTYVGANLGMYVCMFVCTFMYVCM